MPAHPALLRRSIVAALPATSLTLALVLGSPASASPAASAGDLGSGAVGSVTSAQLADVPAGIGLKTRTSVLARSAAATKVRAAKVRAAKVRAAKVRAAKVRAAKVRAAKVRDARARRLAAARAGVRAQVLRVAASLSGRPYQYGATGPRSFDCSGFTRYVFDLAAHRSLVHSSAGQYAAAQQISRSQIRPGDLVFFTHNGRVYHVGIYAGDGLIWHAPHTGDHVRLAYISTSSWVAGRVL